MRSLYQEKKLLFIYLILPGFFSLFSCAPNDQQESPKNSGEWPEMTREAKPWTRWWWMGNAVDKKNLRNLLEKYDAAGLGGVEIAPIYGAKGFESRFLDFLSAEWLEMLGYTVEVADSLDMGVDLTQGTGWPFGGPQVHPEIAASQLVIQEYSYKRENGLDRPVQMEDKRVSRLHHQLLALMAYGPDGEAKEITQYLNDEGNVDWSAEGGWKVLAVFNAQTGQQVKRAAPGGEGFTLDHYSFKAVGEYLDYFEQAFDGEIPGIRSFYNDSFEVYGSDFTLDFFDQFEERRGYDLKAYLPELMEKEPSDKGIRIKSDYRETIHELLLENFTKQWTDWAHGKGKKTKNQAHGSPGNLLDLYATVDIPEGETFGSSYFPIPGLIRDSAAVRNVDPDPIMLKFASSAAHLSGKNLVSSETFTWLGEHFKSSFSQAKPEVEQAFLAGINHVFYHGVTYSPEEVPFPGWLFYASLNLTPQNSLWPHFKGFNDYIARCQAVLQSGDPDNEILMYWPVYDIWADPKDLSRMITVHDIDEWLHPTAFYIESKDLMEKGYSLDFISDGLLDELRVKDGRITTRDNPAAAKVIVIPELHYMPLGTLEKLVSLATAGASIVFQKEPTDIPGFHEVEKKRNGWRAIWDNLPFEEENQIKRAKLEGGEILLGADIPAVLQKLKVERERLTDSGLKYIRRASGDEKYYYLVNHTSASIDERIPLNFQGEAVVLMDPQSGKVGAGETEIRGEQLAVRVQLPAGEAMVLHAVDKLPSHLAPWIYLEDLEEVIEIEGPWELTFQEGGPELPDPIQMDRIRHWTDLEDPKALAFSGQAVYTTDFKLEELSGMEYVLDLGQVQESARVWINDKEVGYSWSIPFRQRVGAYLKEGENTLKVEVVNLMANRIRDMDRKNISWRNYHEINFVNIDYEPFDASEWEIMPSGLSGPIRLEIHR